MTSYVMRHDLDEDDVEALGLQPEPDEHGLRGDALEWIETAAYYQWVNEGCPDGQHLQHWDLAYRMYTQTHGKDVAHGPHAPGF